MSVITAPKRSVGPPTTPNLPAIPYGPRPFQWTVAEFHRVGETGAFENRRPVLIQGTLLEQGFMNPPHATGVTLCAHLLERIFAPTSYARVQLPLVLGQDTDPMPDIAIVPGSPRDYAASHPTTAVLVVEVSDTTLGFDLTEKAAIYAAAGIADYWVLDLTGRRLFVFREPTPHETAGGVYRTHLSLIPGESVAPLAAPERSVAVADLLP